MLLLVLVVENDCELMLLLDNIIEDGNILLLYCRIVDVVGRLKEDVNNRRVVVAILCTTIRIRIECYVVR